MHTHPSPHPSPQRTPLIFQAGASKAGMEFGGKHVEAIFCFFTNIADCKAYTSTVLAAAAAQGRDPRSIKFFLVTMPFIGRAEEAQEKFHAARKRCSIQGGLTRFSGFANVDMSVYGLDEPFRFDGELKENTIQGFIKSMKNLKKGTTPRDVAEMLALGGQGPRAIGTPQMVGDKFEKWVVEGDVDGFNLNVVTNPSSWEDVVDLLVPELQRRGLYWNDYPVPGGTMRENIGNRPEKPFLADDHPKSKFKWDAPKAAVNGNGEKV